ncbi:MAG: ABC transporter ATP-binding protein [Planctomycetota bacterium]|jgi:iron complex transport system ATP-binding protein
MEALELAGATVRYGARTVLDNVSIAFQPGERVALLGPNGSGKTTLLRAIAGIVPVAEGRVHPAGGLTRRDVARRIAYLPQDEFWEFAFSVEDVVRCGRYALAGSLRHDSDADRAAIERAIAAVGLEPLRERSVTELSGGERRRVVLARALAQEAPALLLDEPTTALDLEHSHAVLKALVAREGLVLFATHDFASTAIAGRVVVLDGGRVVADGPPGDVINEQLLRDVFHVRATVRHEDGRIHVVAEL